MNLTMNAYSAAETTSPISAISSVQLPLSSTQKPKAEKHPVTSLYRTRETR